MNRDRLLAELADHTPFDDSEAMSLRRMILFIQENANCFDRSLAIGHMTAAAWLLDPTDSRALLTHHRKLNCWLQLGGHADGCSDLREAALREAQEESGIDRIEFVSERIFDVDVHQIPARPHMPAHLHYDVRFLLRSLDIEFRVSEESHALAWFSRQEIEALELDTSIRRMCAKWRSANVLPAR